MVGGPCLKRKHSVCPSNNCPNLQVSSREEYGAQGDGLSQAEPQLSVKAVHVMY